MTKHDPIINLIEESFKSSDRTSLGFLGTRLMEFAENKASDDESRVYIDAETDAKIRELIECDKNMDLAWMSLASWNMLSGPFVKKFEALVEPLMLNAVYFSHSRFMLHCKTMGRYLGESVINVLDQRAKLYHVDTSDPKDGTSKLKAEDFRKRQLMFRESVSLIIYNQGRTTKIMEVKRG